MNEKFSKIEIVFSENKLGELKQSLNGIGIGDLTISNVLGCGLQKGHKEYYRGLSIDINLLPKMKIEIVVCDVALELAIETIKGTLHTGKMGDGKIFVYDVKNIISISNTDEGAKNTFTEISKAV